MSESGMRASGRGVLTGEDVRYFNLFHSRRDTAERMLHRKVSFPGWSPEQSNCHKNVTHWVRLNPHLKAVRGWTIPSGAVSGRIRYEAHSVVEDAGKLYDITLPNQSECDVLRFLRHLRADEEFWNIEERFKGLLFPLSTSEDDEEVMTRPS